MALTEIKKEQEAEDRRRIERVQEATRLDENKEYRAEVEAERKIRRAKRTLGALLSGKEKVIIDTIPTPVRI